MHLSPVQPECMFYVMVLEERKIIYVLWNAIARKSFLCHLNKYLYIVTLRCKQLSDW